MTLFRDSNEMRNQLQTLVRWVRLSEVRATGGCLSHAMQHVFLFTSQAACQHCNFRFEDHQYRQMVQYVSTNALWWVILFQARDLVEMPLDLTWESNVTCCSCCSNEALKMSQNNDRDVMEQHYGVLLRRSIVRGSERQCPVSNFPKSTPVDRASVKNTAGVVHASACDILWVGVIEWAP